MSDRGEAIGVRCGTGQAIEPKQSANKGARSGAQSARVSASLGMQTGYGVSGLLYRGLGVLLVGVVFGGALLQGCGSKDKPETYNTEIIVESDPEPAAQI